MIGYKQTAKQTDKQDLYTLGFKNASCTCWYIIILETNFYVNTGIDESSPQIKIF